MKDQINRKQTKDDGLYLAGDFFMVRAPALPATTFSLLSSFNDETIPDQPLSTHFYQMLCELVDNSAFIQQALVIASPSLLEGLAFARRNPDTHRAKKVFSSLLRYIIRMSTRATPFGLFAGVAIGKFVSQTDLSLSLSSLGQMRIRPDMEWLMAILQKTEQLQEFVAQLTVQTNQEVYIVGHKGFLPVADVYGQKDKRFISFECTPVIQHILARAKEPILYAELCSSLLAYFPERSSQEIQNILWRFWIDHILVSNLRPPLTYASPAAYLLEQLEKYRGAESVKQTLSTALEKCSRINQADIGGSVTSLYELIHYLLIS